MIKLSQRRGAYCPGKRAVIITTRDVGPVSFAAHLVTITAELASEQITTIPAQRPNLTIISAARLKMDKLFGFLSELD